jgi:hypothetical protein
MPRPNRYPPEFRRDVVELVRSSGKTVAQVARQLGLNRETVRCWVRRDQADSERPPRQQAPRWMRRRSSAPGGPQWQTRPGGSWMGAQVGGDRLDCGTQRLGATVAAASSRASSRDDGGKNAVSTSGTLASMARRAGCSSGRPAPYGDCPASPGTAPRRHRHPSPLRGSLQRASPHISGGAGPVRPRLDLRGPWQPGRHREGMAKGVGDSQPMGPARLPIEAGHSGNLS